MCLLDEDLNIFFAECRASAWTGYDLYPISGDVEQRAKHARSRAIEAPCSSNKYSACPSRSDVHVQMQNPEAGHGFDPIRRTRSPQAASRSFQAWRSEEYDVLLFIDDNIYLYIYIYVYIIQKCE
ncbi:unnamed protein product [Chondrus crispus]|uniref:Uncharacterized protein n=1 Tax=Chondrus crispus TaxID=2769 RepID=R7QHX4_CHOCR|nr:unnamed protein product [Chondrus crispus]CDF37684.1 unnamed protein product [Chondrus crispus]|eukprot:XP_005717555.1 unnamed protein product [Chondrus crispus]